MSSSSTRYKLFRCTIGSLAGKVQWTADGFALGYDQVATISITIVIITNIEIIVIIDIIIKIIVAITVPS